MTLLELIKTSLRTTTTDSRYTGQIKSLLNTAKRELSLSGVHSSWLEFTEETAIEDIDSVVATCVSCYVCMMYPNDSTDKSSWESIFNLHADMIHMRDEYEEEKPAT